jgi:hypothetical protein
LVTPSNSSKRRRGDAPRRTAGLLSMKLSPPTSGTEEISSLV